MLPPKSRPRESERKLVGGEDNADHAAGGKSLAAGIERLVLIVRHKEPDLYGRHRVVKRFLRQSGPQSLIHQHHRRTQIHHGFAGRKSPDFSPSQAKRIKRGQAVDLGRQDIAVR
jgi:hypothetical protein